MMFRHYTYALIGATTFLLSACGGGTQDESLSSTLASAPHALADASLCASNTPGYISANGECGPQFKFPAPQEAAAPASGANPKPQVAGQKAPQAAVQRPQAATSTLTADALFDWAAGQYSSLFWGGSTAGSIFVSGYGNFYYRYWYGSGNYLGVLNGYIYVYGPASDYEVTTVGLLSDYTCYVYSCGSGGGSLSVGNYVTGGFYSAHGYSDYSIYLYGGTSYTFELDGGSLGDPYLELYSPAGALLKSNDDISYPGNVNSRIVYTPGSSGYYTLRASSYGTGYGSFTLSAASNYSGGGGGGGGTGGSGGSGGGSGYITWNGSVNGSAVLDANGESFAFTADTRCLYSFNTGGVTSNFCLYSGAAYGSFAGQYVQVLSVSAQGGGCLAALADSYGRKVDIYTSNGTQYVTVTNESWNTSGCTY
jgi:hypothetical protein